jgi:hypothetical protein
MEESGIPNAEVIIMKPSKSIRNLDKPHAHIQMILNRINLPITSKNE